MRKGLRIAGAIAGGVLAAALVTGTVGCGAQSTGNLSPAATQQAPSIKEHIVTWWGTAEGQIGAIQNDMKTIGADATNMDSIALADDGQQLVHHAVTAENNCPPGALAGPWRAAMEHCINAGQALTNGNFIRATNQLNAAQPHLDKFTSQLQDVVGK